MKKVLIIIFAIFLTLSVKLKKQNNHQSLQRFFSGSSNPNDGRSWVNMFDPWYKDPVNHSSGFCFPQNVKVIQKNKGVINIQDIQINDEILTKNMNCNKQSKNKKCKSFFTRVTGWFHKDHQHDIQYLEITLNNEIILKQDNFYVSEYHNLAVQGQNESESYIYAKDTVGKRLFNNNLKALSNKKVFRKGMYSPMTESNNYLVLTQNEKYEILAHSYSHVKNPERYEQIVDSFIEVWEYINEKPNYQNKFFSIHPAAQFLISIFYKFLDGMKESNK